MRLIRRMVPALPGPRTSAPAVVPAGTASELDAGRRTGRASPGRPPLTGWPTVRMTRCSSDGTDVTQLGQGSMTTSPYGCRAASACRSGGRGRSARARRHRAGGPGSPTRSPGTRSCRRRPSCRRSRRSSSPARARDPRPPRPGGAARRWPPPARRPRQDRAVRGQPERERVDLWPTRVCGSTDGVDSPNTAVAGTAWCPRARRSDAGPRSRTGPEVRVQLASGVDVLLRDPGELLARAAGRRAVVHPQDVAVVPGRDHPDRARIDVAIGTPRRRRSPPPRSTGSRAGRGAATTGSRPAGTPPRQS